MKKKLFIILFGLLFFLKPLSVNASDYNIYDFPITPPIPCNQEDPNVRNPLINCPSQMLPIYQRLGKPCATSYADFLTDPINKHYWVEDPKITAQGKADERARQFIYWVISTEVIEDAPVLRSIWNISSLIALFGVVLVAAIFGIGYIISQRTQYNFNIQIWPTIIKIGMMLLYIAFSAAIVAVLIQFSELLMKFFYENLGGNELFNIYFANPNDPQLIGQSEQSYIGFYGCRDLNIRVKDGIDTEITMLKLTNVTYYVMGTMLLLRKILLWFLLFVSPFLALLMPFVFIRNTGWIWIGVFFQWLFYGPLFTLFLGALAKIWKEGIPWQFDFTRTSVNTKFIPEGYVYPTGINIVYGGPAQRITSLLSRPIDASNNGSYIDTYAEYILTLIMLWAVTFFPWWLLRIFRDYCCEGIFAMKNILLAMYNQMQQNNPPSPIAPKGPTLPSLNLDLKTPVGTGVKVPSFTSLNNFATLRTGDIAKNLNLQATRISDVARAETNKQLKQSLTQNISYLSNPVKATTPAERQQYMKLRAELFNRAIKNDSVARTMLASTSTSQIEKTRLYKEVLTTIPQTVKISVSQIAANETKQPQQIIKNIANTYTTSISNNNSVVQNIANTTKTSQDQVKNILQSYSKQTDQPINNVIKNIAQETKTSESTVKNVLNQASNVSIQAKIIAQTSNIQKLTSEQTTKILNSIRNTVSNTQQNVSNAYNSAIEKITKETNINQSNVKSYVSEVYNSLTQNQQNLEQISNQTGTSQEQVKNIVNSYSTKISSVAEAPQTIINQIAKETNTSKSTVESVINTANTMIKNSNIVQSKASEQKITNEQAQTIIQTITAPNIANQQQYTSTVTSYKSTGVPVVKEQTVQNIVQTVATNETVIQQLSEKTQVAPANIKNILQTYTQNLSNNTSTVTQNIAQQTGVENTQVQNVIQNFSSVVQSNPETVKNISEYVNVSQPAVERVINAVSESPNNANISVMEQINTNIGPSVEAPVVQNIAQNSNTSESESRQAVVNIMNSFVQNDTLINNLSSQTGLKNQQISNIISTYAKNIDQPSTKIIEKISQSAGVPKENVRSTLETITNTALASNTVVAEVAQKSGMKQEEVANVIQTQMQIAAAPEQHIEKTIQIPQTISLEDYEDVKTMWMNHYEEGDVPVSENIKNRSEWLDHEIVFITNTLNKMLSTDEKLRQEGLDELGYLLPIFLINNMKGDELIVYLKAKLEAAKTTKKIIEHENKAAAKATKTDEEEEIFVDLKQEAKNDKYMSFDEEEESNRTPKSIEERVRAADEKISAFETSSDYDETESNSNLSDTFKTVKVQAFRIADIFKSEAKILVNTNTSEYQKPSEEERQKILTTLPQLTSISVNKIAAQESNKTEDKINTITSTYTTSISNNDVAIKNISNAVNISEKAVRNILNNYPKHINESLDNIIQNIAQETNIAPESVRNVFMQINSIGSQGSLISKTFNTKNISNAQGTKILTVLQQTITGEDSTVSNETPITTLISQKADTTESVSKEIIFTILTSFIQDEKLTHIISEKTGLQTQQLNSLVTTYIQNINQPAPIILQKITQSSGIAKDSINKTLLQIIDIMQNSNNIIHEVAEKEGIKEEEVANVMQTQMQIAAEPERNIEKSIQIPQSISLEDYEEVKKMWMEHYENGEIPSADPIKNRLDWIKQDIIFITNVLNKLLSTDEKLRQEGLDEVSYLLPIFLINNLTGEELIVYLKAKLEAAKTILAILEREEKLRNEMQKQSGIDEELVNITAPEATSKQVMSAELPDSEALPSSIEDKVKAVQQKLSTLEKSPTEGMSLENIKDKLEENAEKKATD